MKNIAQLILQGLKVDGHYATSLGLNATRTQMCVSFIHSKVFFVLEVSTLQSRRDSSRLVFDDNGPGEGEGYARFSVTVNL